MVLDHADYELVFDEHGAVILLEGDELLWSADGDDDFADEFDGDLFEGEDAEEILEYLEERRVLPPGAVVDIVEETAADDDDGDEDEDD